MEQNDVPVPLTVVVPPPHSSSSSGAAPETLMIPVLIATFEQDIARLCQELHTLADCTDKPSLAHAKAIDETIERLQHNTAQLKDMFSSSSSRPWSLTCVQKMGTNFGSGITWWTIAYF